MKKSDLLFYEIMKYPVPKNSEYFSTEKLNTKATTSASDFSRNEETPLLNEYINHIKKHKHIFQSLPWIKKIYLCNSITFNSLHKGSDIDLFIITKKDCIWRARFFSAIIFFFLKLKRNSNQIDKRYCLSFYVSEDYQNIYNISLEKTDIYLGYWLAHLVLLYKETENQKTIYQYNQRLFSLLPNLPKQQNINIGIKYFIGNSDIKNKIEKYLGGFVGTIVEYLIKTIRVPILIYKTKRLKETGKNIIFNDHMLKFYNDKRKKISLLYRTKRADNN